MLGGEKQHSSTRVTLAPPNQGFGARCDFLVAYGGKKNKKKNRLLKFLPLATRVTRNLQTLY